jgi:hypothetical protein
MTPTIFIGLIKEVSFITGTISFLDGRTERRKSKKIINRKKNKEKIIGIKGNIEKQQVFFEELVDLLIACFKLL